MKKAPASTLKMSILFLITMLCCPSHTALSQTQSKFSSVWSVGKKDQSPKEFAYYDRDFSSFSSAYKNQAVLFEIGTDKEANLPFFLPGPSDGWVAYTSNQIIFRFAIDNEQIDCSTKLRIDFVETHPSYPPVLEVKVNDFITEVQVPEGNNINYFSDKKTNSNNLYLEIDIPGGQLKKGNNNVSIKSISGGWSVFDNISFSADGIVKLGNVKSLAEITLLNREENTLSGLVYGKDKKLYHPVKLQLLNWGKNPQQVTVRLENGEAQQFNVNKGLNSIEVLIPKSDVKKEEKVSLATKSNEIGNVTVNVFPVREWQLNVVQHTHTDIGFTRPQYEILSEHIRFIDYALDYCDMTDNYPDDAKFRWTCESAWAVSEYIRTRPEEQVERLKKRIKDGRIEVTAMYFNYDELPGEQELAYSLYPLKKFKEIGIEVKTAMQNDVNGIAWNFSEYFPELGVKYLIMGTHGHKALISFPIPTAFWWISPSGKKTLAFRAEHYNMGNFLQIETGNFAAFESRTLKYLKSLEEKGYPMNITGIQYSGYFTDNSPPSTAACDIVKKWNEKYAFPKIRLAVASEFMEIVEKKYGDELQSYRAAWPDWWTDGFGSAAREASIARYAQSDLMSNQITLSMMKLLGSKISPTVQQEIDEANKALLFYGEHTFGYYTSISDPFGKETMDQRSLKGAYAWESYRRSRTLGETALGFLQAYIPRNKNNANIVVFNPLNWEYSGQTVIYADHEVLPVNKKTIVKDEKGNSVKMQIIRSYKDASYWAVWVDKIAPLGVENYTIQVIPESPAETIANSNKINEIENQWYRIGIDMEKGIVTEWFDKDLNENLISGNAQWKMGELIYETDDVRGSLDKFRPGNFKRYSPTNIKYNGFQAGDIWDTYQFTGTSPAGMGEDNFTLKIQLYKTKKQVNFTYRLKKKQVVDPEAVYVSFPFELEQGKIFFDVPGGTIEAGVDQIPGSANDWNTVQNFASVRNDSGQIILGSREIPLMQFGNINLGRFKDSSYPETNHIFTWPMNNYWVTNFNAEQYGEFEWTYFLTSSNDASIEYANKFAWGNRVLLQNRVIPAGVSDNKEGLNYPILSVNPSNVLIVNMTPKMDENSIILHLREIGGKESVLDISSAYRKNLNVSECNPLGEIQPAKETIKIKAWESKFVKINW